MSKKKIAVLAGGYSGESVISHRSVATVIKNLDDSQYDLYKIIIEKDSWYFENEGKRIEIDKNDFSLTLEDNKITFDCVFIVIHGAPGEDGKLQGYFEMLDIPFTTCSSIVSGLTFNKSFCNKVVRDFKIVKVAKSYHLFRDQPYNIGAILEKVTLPLFVKPNESGSSLGVSKVLEVSDLAAAIEKAFTEDHEVLVEEFIEGRELTIGAYKIDGKIYVLPPTEIISKNSFFDFEAKYTTGVTDEITPADVPESINEQLKYKTEIIYRNLSCDGVVRIDYIWNKQDDELYFLEVNTMPGQSENSLIPQQVRAAGMDLKDFYGMLLEEALKTEKKN